MEYAPESLWRTNPTCIQIELNLILLLSKPHGGAIMAFVDVLVDVLDTFDRGSALHIDVALILPDQIWTIRNDPTVIQLMIIHCNSPAIVRPAIAGIRILRQGGGLMEGFGEILGASAILHTSFLHIELTTGGMHHTPNNSGIEFWLSVRTGDLCRYHGVHLLRLTKFKLWSKDNHHMHMREATFLKLLYFYMSNCLSKDATLVNILYESLGLFMKDPGYEVRAISRSLIRKEIFNNLWPVWISSHGDEQITATKVTVDGQCILTLLYHMPSTP